MSHTIVAYGEALWDLLPAGPVLGGAPLNFAYRVGTLGNRCVMISRLGRDELGRKAFEQMRRLGMDTGGIQWDDELPTGTVDIRFDDAGNPDYTINPAVAYDAIRLEEKMTGLAEEADCLCFGTLVQRAAVSRRTLSVLLDSFRGRYRLLDVNLRRDCHTGETIRSSLERADVLKMNEEEAPVLAALFGIAEAGHLPRIIGELIERADLSHCVCTLGSRGVLAGSRGRKAIYLPTYYVDVVDSCGAGDAFTAGFVHMILEGGGLVEACRRGNALGSLVAAQKGATGPVSAGEIEEILRSGPPDRIDPRFESLRV